MMLIHHQKNQTSGFALLLAMAFAAISLLILITALSWSASGNKISERNNAYNRAVSAAEAGTEAVMARMDRDFQNQSIDYADLTPYRTTTPATYITNGWASDYQFSDNAGHVGQASVTSVGSSSTTSTNVDPSLPGLYGIVFPCTVISAARTTGNTDYDVGAAVQQDFQLASIPIYQFQPFYSVDMEINPSPVMKITGRVHGNADIYMAPVAGLEFVDPVEAVGNVIFSRMTDDPQYGSAKVAPVFDSGYKEKASSLSLPIGTNNSPSEVAKVLDVPPVSEDPRSPLGTQRFYNKVDLIVSVSSGGAVSVKSGRWNNSTSVTPDLTNPPASYSWIKTSGSFTDAREQKTTIVTDIDVAAFDIWITNTSLVGGVGLNSLALSKEGHQLNSIYVDDERVNASKLTVARVINGQQLPGDGLTVATFLPLYVQGNFNAPDLTPGSTNTASTRPASLVGDAITVLSGAWLDAGSSGSPSAAVDTTVNAAFLAGIVPTANVGGVKHYSGGLENFPRFLEVWTGKTFTYNGSMVVMFYSRSAKSFWNSTGTSYYNPPIRKWAFDRNFLDQAKLPPVTPQVKKIIRNQWRVIAASGS